jgi:hypothetical protein
MSTIDMDKPYLNQWGMIKHGVDYTTEALYQLVPTTILSILKMEEK